MKVFDINSLDEWREAFNGFPESFKEVYFTPEYYVSLQEHEKATPVCIYSEIENAKFLYPFFIKEIEGFELDKPYYDIFTAYGYGGVLTNLTDIPIEIQREFNDLVNTWCIENDIVAEFIRELPYVNNNVRDADYTIVRNNVFIELEIDYKVENRHVRKNLNKAERNGLRYEWDPLMNNIDTFIKLYSDSFQRIEMDDSYSFPNDYYFKLKDLFAENVGLINIYHNDEIINSMIIFRAFNKLVCHLIGTNYNYISLRPNDLIYFGAIEISKEHGINLISMGGGKTLDDSLFKFKEKFGNCIKDVFVGKNIVNKKIYEQLIKQWEEKHPAHKDSFKNFFLRYRLNPGK